MLHDLDAVLDGRADVDAAPATPEAGRRVDPRKGNADFGLTATGPYDVVELLV